MFDDIHNLKCDAGQNLIRAVRVIARGQKPWC